MATSNEAQAAAFFVAVDGGPRETLAPIAAAWGLALAEVGSPADGSEHAWAERMTAHRPRLVVVGTSDSERGCLVERCVRRVASVAGLPIVAIEDFPGNYVDIPGGEASVLLVESESAREIALARLSARAPRIDVVPSPRYDGYRARLRKSRQATRDRWDAEVTAKVLWAGQPDTADGITTLRALAPLLRRHAVELMFKAHPRDRGYAAGAYDALLHEFQWSDWTRASVADTLDAAPRLVVTQFSSLAIGAGFFGIPGLWVLLPEAGGARLRQKKGYDVPPVCLAGAGGLVTDAGTLGDAVEQALTNIALRARLMRCFDVYFDVDAPAVEAVVEKLRAVALNGN